MGKPDELRSLRDETSPATDEEITESEVNAMMHGQAGEPATPVKKRLATNRIIFAGVLLILLAFLTSFLPGYAKDGVRKSCAR